ncbi:hypothetical protein EV693_11832 [Nicoletella semolina]|uniref:HrgA protein n=1 Tax=Nicoletella semolina TaxID=271160 RepID=A0A4R2N4I3_9PAST|nr:HrgA protein [Nicoletella semolina]MDH2925072.1 hypothetical protein [Nicoletella semolina]TCP15412.1 hypothetical protein EV693_11832 [Nicoletella semolina]
MKNLSKAEKIVLFLKNNLGKKFTTRQIVDHLISTYPEDYTEKRKLYKDEKIFISQLNAENGWAHLKPIHHLISHEKDPITKKFVYWYRENMQQMIVENTENFAKEYFKIKEQELYPVLIKYLSKKLDLYCLRIDEKTSSNTNGRGANKWLHPDVVAMKAIDQHWESSVKDCMKQSSSQNVKLFSFEVKKELVAGNLRESFFQTVSNSSWANEGYLVAVNISKNCYNELQVLSSLHGIGVILLDLNSALESKILFPARHKFDVDWQSVNRIVNINKDFREYIDYVSIYYRTGKIIEQNWNK